MLNLAKSIPPSPPSSSSSRPAGPAASPPALRPEEFEDYPAFRETFLLYFTDLEANATLRKFGRLLHELVLEFWHMWPDHPEGLFVTELRAVLADLRHVQGSLEEWTGPAFTREDPREEGLARLGAEIAQVLGDLGDRLERELATLRGDA